MKGKILLCVVLVGTMIVSATNFYEKPVKVDANIQKLNTLPKNIVKPVKASPAPIKMEMKADMVKARYLVKPLDIQITFNEGIDQNPAIVSDWAGDLLTLHEMEYEEDIVIGISNSIDVGNTWTQYYFDVDGSPTQPRLDFYSGKTAYGTWTADPMAAFGYAYYAEFPDITDPEAGEYGWVYYSLPWGDYDIGVPFTSSDVACYSTPNPPTPDFWGIVAFTGDQEYEEYAEDNTFMFQYNTEEGYVTIIFFYGMDVDVYNVAADIDESTGWFIMTADFVNETNPAIYGTYVLARKITASEDWWQGEWNGVIFYNCSHPAVDAKNGRIYIVTEMMVEDGSKEIACWTTTNPANWQMWEGYYVTISPGENEGNPAITAIDDLEAIVVYTRNGNVYTSKTGDGGKTWSTEEQVNDISDSAIEQYGCLDVADAYAVWTDVSTGNYEIFFDVVGKVPVIEISISGGFGVKATVSNTGDAAAEDIPWSIDIDGLVFIGKHKEGVIPSLQPGESTTISSGFILGIGPITVTVSAGGATASADGFAIGPIVIGI